MRKLFSFLADTDLNIHYIQNKEEISSNVAGLVTAPAPTQDLSVEVETEVN